jgi:hypothetical protein
MTGLEYVHHRLHQDFDTSADLIIQHLSSVMKELTTPNDLEQDLTFDFQNLLV